MKATSKENSIAALAPIGIGRMYGPISPPTNAMGRIAATTASVARMVGLPTSSTASTATSTGRPADWRHAPVPHDVLDHHDRVVHQNADGEDQREERNPVERVAVEKEHQQRQREGHGNRDKHDQRFPDPKREGDEDTEPNHGNQHVVKQFVGFFRRRIAVVSRDREIEIAGQQRGTHDGELVLDLVRHRNGIGALPFRHRNGHRGVSAAVARVEAHVGTGWRVAVGHSRDVAESDRAVALC